MGGHCLLSLFLLFNRYISCDIPRIMQIYKCGRELFPNSIHGTIDILLLLSSLRPRTDWWRHLRPIYEPTAVTKRRCLTEVKLLKHYLCILLSFVLELHIYLYIYIYMNVSFPKRVNCQSKSRGRTGNAMFGDHILEKSSLQICTYICMYPYVKRSCLNHNQTWY